jgi:LPS O-antigen subunit length determinant protein (WzzB/FepE family)
MTKEYNNNSKYFKDWSTKKLKEEAVSYDQLINQIESYGSKDVSNLLGVCLELERRGIEIHTNIAFN